jgi:hypothetical protein
MPVLCGQIAQRNRQMRLADTGGAEENDVLGALNKGKPGELVDLLAWDTGGAMAQDALTARAEIAG